MKHFKSATSSKSMYRIFSIGAYNQLDRKKIQANWTKISEFQNFKTDTSTYIYWEVVHRFDFGTR